MNTPNREYWKGRDGELYADQQRVRRESGNENYARQEAWLVDFLVERSQAIGRPVRVLDVGMGFGRLARVLSEYTHVDYYGHDISSAMLKPFMAHPPARLAGEMDQRIRIGDRADEAMRGLEFDVVFTISVFIHNNPQQAADLLSQMRSLLASDGRICLIENRPVSISLLSNMWHDGCWSHDVVGTLAPDMNVDVEDGILVDHAIYILHETSGDSPRVLNVPGVHGFEPISEGDYLLRSKEATVAVVRNLESEVTLSEPDLAELRDASELYRQAEHRSVQALEQAYQKLGKDSDVLSDHAHHLTAAISSLPKLAARILELSQLHDQSALVAEYESSRQQQEQEIAGLRELQVTSLDQLQARDGEIKKVKSELVAMRESLSRAQAVNAVHATALDDVRAQLAASQRRNDGLQWQQDLRDRIYRMTRALDHDAEPQAEARYVIAGSADPWPATVTPYDFNSRRDTRFAQTLAGHERVCHMMHKEWFGIRAACGSLPGHKLAVTSYALPGLGEIDEVARLFADNQIDRIVIHGFSDGMSHWVKGLAAAGFDRIYLVWHGAPVMWVHAEERRLFALAYTLVRKGFIRKFNGMRGGTYAALDENATWTRQIYNMPPRYRNDEARRAPRRHEDATIFAPSWNLLHKNLFTNVAAAAATPEVSEIWVLAEDFALPYAIEKKVHKLPKLDQEQMMESMALCDVVMNASVVDCHPMVELEALAAGTPALRGRLGMDALEDHPYVLATQVNDPLSVADLRATLQRMLSIPNAEMDEMMASYSRRVTALSFERYSELMEL